jgi:multidrug efflux system membrane fusion protein
MKLFHPFLLLPIAGALASCGDGDGSDAAKKGRPPAMVGAIAASTADYAPRLVALGTVTPLQSVAVKTRTDGQLTAILFREGDNVRAGQALFRLDDRAAQAQLAQARAMVASMRAAAAQARADLSRAEALVGKGFISGAVLDQRKAGAQSAEAAISGAAAQVQNAEALLSYLTIRAPVSGRTGELGFRLGANVRAADTVPLVTINQLSPISVRFLVPPEQIQTVRDAMGGGALQVIARNSNGVEQGGAAADIDTPMLATGRLAFLDNNVDPGTGSVAAKAEFANGDDRLWPGAIVNVELALGNASARIVLPEAAVQTGRDAPFVWLIGADGTVAMRDVTVAGRANGRAFLASGVAPGERIVVDALSKLRPGDRVRTRAGSSGPSDAPRTASGEAAARVPPVGG